MPFRLSSIPALAACAALFCAALAPIPANAAPDGAALYAAQCSACHQADAGGVAGQFPPLKNRLDKIAATPAGKAYLADVLTHGLAGPIEAAGDSYSGYMPSFAKLDNDDIAAILTYVSALGDTKPPPTFGAPDIATARAQNLTAAGVGQLRSALAAQHPLP